MPGSHPYAARPARAARAPAHGPRLAADSRRQRLIDWDKSASTPPRTAPAHWPVNTLSALDLEAVARELGFSRVTDNSIDGTAARDLVAEFAFSTAMTGVDISRLSEGDHHLERRSSPSSSSTTAIPPAPPSCRRRRTLISPELARGKSADSSAVI